MPASRAALVPRADLQESEGDHDVRITIFTSNQPRHLALINSLANQGHKTYAVLECNTVFPGVVSDFFKSSAVMQQYFQNVRRAEQELFGDLQFTAERASILAIKSGDLNFLTMETLAPAMDSDVFIVFGASYIKGWLVDFLVQRRAVNIHNGLSPYYLGSSCNFWALHDNRPECVGTTIHLLSKGLDTGPILYHVIPKFKGEDPFVFTMKAVKTAQISLLDRIEHLKDYADDAVAQDRSKQLRYSRNAEFNDAVAAEFLSRGLDAGRLGAALNNATPPELIRPFFN
jgi:methionyl-tRNA formyltransferase